MRITENDRKFNQLVNRYKQGDNWITSKFDIDCYAWRQSQKPWGWSPFGVALLDEFELEGYRSDINNLISKHEVGIELTPNQWQSIDFLKSIGVII